MFTFLVVSALSGLSAVEAQSSQSPQQAETKLQGLTSSEANLLIAKLQHAQAEVKAGRSQSFELLTGSIASYPAARVAPRDTFIRMPFAHPWSIERKPTTGLWQPYEIDYFPPGPDTLMWKVTVTVGQVGQLVRVEMLYTAQPPF